jgi:hypothetical protein
LAGGCRTRAGVRAESASTIFVRRWFTARRLRSSRSPNITFARSLPLVRGIRADADPAYPELPNSRSQHSGQAAGRVPGIEMAFRAPVIISAVIVHAIIDIRSSIGHPLGDTIETFVRCEDAERFVDEVRGDAELASSQSAPFGLTRTSCCRQSDQRGTNPVSAGRATRSAGAKSPRSPTKGMPPTAI